jgi:DNA-binding response OmpR family regulator
MSDNDQQEQQAMAPVVLIVDDDLLLCNLLKIALKRSGTITRCPSGKKRRNTWKQPGKLAAADIMMGRYGRFCRHGRVREHPVHHDPPIIMLTARSASPVSGAGRGNDYLVKPIAPTKSWQQRAVLPPDAE